MEVAFSAFVGIFFAVAVYLLLSKHIIRIMLGAAILSNGVNLLIFTAGRLTRQVPPIIPPGETVPLVTTANPLPQALVLTAIVIAFSFFAFLLVLSYRAYQELGTDNTEEMRLAEPEAEGLPPMRY
jgi:multicomponent Na+:H+ antiporter subunit C